MLTHILHNSVKLCTFLDQLHIDLSKPQRQHVLNMANALLVCEDTKTLAALQRQLIEAPDASNMANFLRISPWQADDMRTALQANQVTWAIAHAERTGAPKEIYINIDDSLGEKDKHTTHLEPVERINRHRPPGQRVPFRNKNRLARSILETLRPLLPKGWYICVQFDSWYASEQLIKYVRRQGWHVTCGLKCNRKLNGKRIDRLAYALGHRRYTHVLCTAADGNKTTYYVRDTTGRLQNIPFDVRVFFSKRHPREKSQAYFMCTDLTRTAQRALQGYGVRWSCEVVNFYLKTQLGLADFRVQSYEAVDKYMVVVLLTWAYVEWRFEQERTAQIKTYGNVIRRHQDEHAVDWLTGALEMMRQTGDMQQVLQHFLRLETPDVALVAA